MNKKRWIGVALAIILAVIAIVTPKYTKKIEEQAVNTTIIEDRLMKAFGEVTEPETVIVPGDSNNRILVLTLDGTIQSGGSDSPFSSEGYNHEFFLDQLDMALEDDTVKGILFKVNTPGGGVYESAEIRRGLLALQDKGIPIYVAMENMAASGGYYVTAEADKIYAAQETITGSIGVISQTIDISEFLEEHGIKINAYASGDMKTMGSPYKTASEEEIAVWKALTEDAFSRFVSIVANGRDMSESRVREIADGRIYTANQALEIGLIDEIGFRDEALEGLMKENDLENAEVFEYNYIAGSPFANIFKFKIETSPANELETLIEANFNNMPKLYYLYGGN